MRAVQIDAYGTTPTLRTVADPVAGPGELLVRVAGASVNPLDLKIAAGHVAELFPVRFPYGLGTDVSGTVVSTGPGAEGWAPGDTVVARLDPVRGGGLADLVTVPAELAVAAPASIPLALASGAPTAAATAWQALTEVADVRAGQRILVHAAAGGVGSFAVQMGRGLGAQVVATASGTGLRIARDLGATEVIDHTDGPFESRVGDLDVVLDTVGGRVEERSLRTLRPGGLLVATPVPPDQARATSRGLRAEFVFHRGDRARLATVMSQFDQGLRVLLDRQVDLSTWAETLADVTAGHARGKIIFTP